MFAAKAGDNASHQAHGGGAVGRGDSSPNGVFDQPQSGTDMIPSCASRAPTL